MSLTDKVFILAAIFLIDIVFFMLPLTTFFAAFIFFRRPLWFRDFVLMLYERPS